LRNRSIRHLDIAWQEMQGGLEDHRHCRDVEDSDAEERLEVGHLPIYNWRRHRQTMVLRRQV
jgi:hypothetical protein